MPVDLNLKDMLKVIKDKTFQKASAALLIIVASFGVGRLTAPGCNQAEICGDIIKDRDELSSQLEQQYLKCQDEKVDSLKDLRVELNASCAIRVDEALAGCDFSEEIHCPICIARGVCQ